ncbi:unnamed protein product [Effrenium voratum]|nr:unnamed protein product [Effrenium voratum]
MGGRDAVEKTLRTQAVNWQHLRYDAAWVVARCTQCVTRKTSGIAAPGCRSLPRPLCAGDVVGVDLKMVTPPGGDRWCMMVLLDFTSNRLWAWDMDEDKKGVGDVQSLLVRWCEIEVPLIWSDGSQFRSVSEAVKLSLGVEPRFIPPGRPQSNGLEVCLG